MEKLGRHKNRPKNVTPVIRKLGKNSKTIKPKSSVSSSRPHKTQEQETSKKVLKKFKDLDYQIFFHFKNAKDPSIEYAAHYLPKGLTGEWFSLHIQPGGSSIYQKKAWTIFQENATFDDIFEGLRTYDIHDIIHSLGKPNFSDYKKWTDIKFLEELSEYPEWLIFIETFAATRLSFLLKTAQVANSVKAKEARENVKDYLIPKRQGKLKSYPVNLQEGLFLLEKLSRHISSKCKSFLSGEAVGDVNKYDDLQEWGKTEEPRIVGESLDSLSLLVHDPVTFAEKKLAQELYVSVGSLRVALYK